MSVLSNYAKVEDIWSPVLPASAVWYRGQGETLTSVAFRFRLRVPPSQVSPPFQVDVGLR